jgi:serine/threonine-protein kinase
VSDFFDQDSREYLVMDFFPGADLRQLVEEARRRDPFLDEATVLGWAAQLTDALSYLHTQETPVLHRDIKPANIKLTPRGTVKLVDFGLVKLLQPDESRTVTIVQETARWPTAFGTIRRRFRHRCSFRRVSLGATLYHLLTGPPPMRSNVPQAGKSHPPRYQPRVSPQTGRALLAAMAQHPDDRPQSALELRYAVQRR